MQVGIIGKAGSGKTTIFNALSGSQTSLYDKKSENISVMKVPDKRVDFLEGIFKPPKKTYAEILFVDIGAGFPDKGGEKAASAFSPQVVAKMKEMDALVVVTNCFSESGSKKAATDLSDVIEELILLDLVGVEEKLDRNKKENKKTIEIDTITKLKGVLDTGKMLKGIELNDAELKAISGYRFLSMKPVLALLNKSEKGMTEALPGELLTKLKEFSLDHLSICGQVEMEIGELSKEEQLDFLKAMGLDEPAKNLFIRKAYNMLDYITFLTMGEDEVRAWPIKRGINARKAAGKVHSDIERGFIRAEVIKYADFEQNPDEQKIKSTGKFKIEGKEYIVEDGDIIYFRFNV